MESPATTADYRAAVARFCDVIERLLATGRAAQVRADELQRRLDAARPQLRPQESLPAVEQRELRELAELHEKLGREFNAHAAAPSNSIPPSAIRALSHRHRI